MAYFNKPCHIFTNRSIWFSRPDLCPFNRGWMYDCTICPIHIHTEHDLTHSHVQRLFQMWPDSFKCGLWWSDLCHWTVDGDSSVMALGCPMYVGFVCDMTHSLVPWLIWHDSFTCAMTHMVSRIRIYLKWHDSFTCSMTHLTPLIYTCHDSRGVPYIYIPYVP